MNVQRLIQLLNTWRKRLLYDSGVIEPECTDQKIPFDFIAGKLQAVVRVSRDVIGRKVIVPNTYIVRFSPEDRALRRHIEPVVIDEMLAIVKKEILRLKGIIPDERVSVEIETDESLEKGSFYIDCLFKEKKKSSEKSKKRVADSKVMTIRKIHRKRDLSETCVPPPGTLEMVDGTFVRSLLGSDQNGVKQPGKDRIMCLVNLRDERGRRTFYLPPGRYTIGRGVDSDIQLDPNDLKVSRRHADLQVESDGVTVNMLGRNGGKLNDENIESGVEFFAGSGDKVIIGDSELTLRIESEQDEK